MNTGFNINNVDTSIDSIPVDGRLTGKSTLMTDVGLPHMRIYESSAVYDHWRHKVIVPDSDNQFWLLNPILGITHKISASKLTGFFHKAPWRLAIDYKELRYLGYPHYWVMATGQVFAETKMDYLKPKVNKRGYLVVSLTNPTGDLHEYPIHRLVAKSFLENVDNKLEVNHIDGDKLNNNVSNLEWVTKRENMTHAASILHRYGQLSEATVHEICKQLSQRISPKDISTALDVPYDTILNIKQHLVYKYISKNYNWED